MQHSPLRTVSEDQAGVGSTCLGEISSSLRSLPKNFKNFYPILGMSYSVFCLHQPSLYLYWRQSQCMRELPY
jgi:hypothetical protein